jgi:hypothetical protein
MFVIRNISTFPTMDTISEKPFVTKLYGYGGFNCENLRWIRIA